MYISSSLRQAVAQNSLYRCGYCLTSELIVGSEFTVDHIIPQSLGGPTSVENLCLAYWGCNLHKHDRLVALDPDTDILVRLFHPNQQRWQDNFAWFEKGLLIVGMTPTGRATIQALQLNRPPLSNLANYGFRQVGIRQ